RQVQPARGNLGPHRLQHGVASGDHFMTCGHWAAALFGLSLFAPLLGSLALARRMVGAVLGLGRGALAAQAATALTAAADLRALLGPGFADGATALGITGHLRLLARSSARLRHRPRRRFRRR